MGSLTADAGRPVGGQRFEILPEPSIVQDSPSLTVHEVFVFLTVIVQEVAPAGIESFLEG